MNHKKSANVLYNQIFQISIQIKQIRADMEHQTTKTFMGFKLQQTANVQMLKKTSAFLTFQVGQNIAFYFSFMS